MTTATKRLPLLDLLRGIAILGTLASNIWLFAAPGGEASVLDAPMPGLLDDPIAFVTRFLANGKFLSTLTILFGAGLAIQFAAAARHGRRWPGRYLGRAGFLFVEGALHFVLVFAFDVLMGYAVVAVTVAFLLNRSERTRRVVGWTAVTVHLAVMALLTMAPSVGGSGADPEVVALYRDGDWWSQVLFRLDNAAVFRIEPVLTFGLLVTLFLTGVRLFRAGAFGDDATGRRLRHRMTVWGLGIGLPLNLATSLAGERWFFVDRYVAAPVLALGVIGLAARLTRSGRFSAALSRLGRMAMSGYVAQNLVAALCCYGFGLGLASAGFAGSAWVVALWAAISAGLLLWSTLWLRRFSAGPLETVQKRLLR